MNPILRTYHHLQSKLSSPTVKILPLSNRDIEIIETFQIKPHHKAQYNTTVRLHPAKNTYTLQIRTNTTNRKVHHPHTNTKQQIEQELQTLGWSKPTKKPFLPRLFRPHTP